MNKKPIITHDAVHAVSAKLPALAGEIITGAIALLLIAAPASAQTPDADLDAFITQSMVQGGHPGLAALIIKHGAVVWSGNYGLAQVQPAVAVTDDTLFMLGSVSKTVTAAAILQLWEQGRFGLDDDINDYLPFRVVNPHFPDVPITFRMLLTHSSSIQDNSWMCLGSHMYSDGDSPISLRDFVEGRLVPGGAYYASSYMVAPPGTVFDYSNVGFTLLGYLVESISGIPFDAYTRQNIFDPLGMDSTGWHLADLGSASIAMPGPRTSWISSATPASTCCSCPLPRGRYSGTTSDPPDACRPAWRRVGRCPSLRWPSPGSPPGHGPSCRSPTR